MDFREENEYFEGNFRGRRRERKQFQRAKYILNKIQREMFQREKKLTLERILRKEDFSERKIGWLLYRESKIRKDSTSFRRINKITRIQNHFQREKKDLKTQKGIQNLFFQREKVT